MVFGTREVLKCSFFRTHLEYSDARPNNASWQCSFGGNAYEPDRICLNWCLFVDHIRDTGFMSRANSYWLGVVAGKWFWRICVCVLTQQEMGWDDQWYISIASENRTVAAWVSMILELTLKRRFFSFLFSNFEGEVFFIFFLHHRYKGTVLKICKRFVCMKKCNPPPLPFVSPPTEESIFTSWYLSPYFFFSFRAYLLTI